MTSEGPGRVAEALEPTSDGRLDKMMGDTTCPAQGPSTPADGPVLPTLIPVRDVAYALGVHAHTVKRLIASGALPAFRVGPRGDLRCDIMAVRAYLAQQAVR